MADIVMFPQDGGTDEDDSTSRNDSFLKDEGLDLLAAYRRINDPSVRMSLMQLVKTLAGKAPAGQGRDGGDR